MRIDTKFKGLVALGCVAIVVAGGLALTFSGLASAHGKRHDARPGFADLDTNADGQLDRDEILAQINARAEMRADHMFERLDADASGTVSAEEFENAHPRWMKWGRHGGGKH